MGSPNIIKVLLGRYSSLKNQVNHSGYLPPPTQKKSMDFQPVSTALTHEFFLCPQARGTCVRNYSERVARGREMEKKNRLKGQLPKQQDICFLYTLDLKNQSQEY
jgi:hypothetical protein